MFIGEYNHSIDEKGRLAVPAKFRAELEDGAVVTRGLDNCLFLYTQQEWNILAPRIAQLPIHQANSRAFSRLMLSGAMDVQVDKQGRIIVPDYLRSYAKLKKKVVIAGLYNRLEVWDEAIWADYKMHTEEESGDIAEQLGELGV
ncbi:division/cell wall cluster transcriptional repressor MraZ [Candidatus Uhrbacteria bacterium]|nr:division/cell wall cluster transcriptional repressor MraZ [Candidatus Uhrbacteria bacterium]